MDAILKFAPLTEWTVRLPALIVGILDLVLMCSRLVTRLGYGSIAGGRERDHPAGSSSPAHFMHSRFAMDYIFPIPYVLGWLLGLIYFERTREARSGCVVHRHAVAWDSASTSYIAARDAQ